MDSAAIVLKEAATIAGTTIMTERWHHFGDGHGYTGVIILSESHISVHTWPEKGYAAIDVFFCGSCDPMDTLETIIKFYRAEKTEQTFLERGKELA